MATYTVEQIKQAVKLLSYLSAAQRPTVATPPRSSGHPTTSLLEEYADFVFLVEVGPEFSLDTIHHTIGKGPHSSTLSPEPTAF